jgi:hypothetical protein
VQGKQNVQAPQCQRMTFNQAEMGTLTRATLAHGNADLRALERRAVVHAIAGHCHGLPKALQVLHDLQLLLGRGAGKHDLWLGQDVIPVILSGDVPASQKDKAVDTKQAEQPKGAALYLRAQLETMKHLSANNSAK